MLDDLHVVKLRLPEFVLEKREERIGHERRGMQGGFILPGSLATRGRHAPEGLHCRTQQLDVVDALPCMGNERVTGVRELES